jgi:hypothetical protein
VAVRAPGAAAIAGLFCLGVLAAVASSGVVVRPATDYRFAIELVPAPQPASTPTPMEVVLPQPAPTSVPTSVPTPAPTPDPCDSLDVPPGASVAQVVGPAHLKPAQTTVTKSRVVQYARLMCKGVKFPPVHVTYGATYDTLTDGHHRFVASRLAHKPIGEVPDPYTPRNLKQLGADWPAVEWRNVGWR